jgi:hypothetical protein
MNIQHVFDWLATVFAIIGGIVAIRFVWVTDGMKDMSSRWAVPLAAVVFSTAPLTALFLLLSRPLSEQNLFKICSCVLLVVSCVVGESIAFARALQRRSSFSR